MSVNGTQTIRGDSPGSGIEHAFLKELSKYINGGCLHRADKVISSVARAFPFYMHAGRICKDFKRSKSPLKEGEVKEVPVMPYTGENRFVHQMRDYLAVNLQDDLLEVIVHGSIGTGEEIPYSDFDALVILKDAVFESRQRVRETAMKLSRARSIMYAFDPLQHHGWFVLTESSLQNYPLAYFPPELYAYAKSILFPAEHTLKIRHAYAADFKSPFFHLCDSLSKKLAGRKLPPTIYGIKNLLSEFMLLPALYVQARDGKGLFKKFSFESARADFSTEPWKVMDEVSGLRLNWKVNLPETTRKKLVDRIDAKRNFLAGDTVPEELKMVLNEDFLNRMLLLVQSAKEKIK